MSWGDAIEGGSALIGGWLGDKASDAQGEAAEKWQQWIEQNYSQTRDDMSPFIQGGQNSLAQLMALNGGNLDGFYKASPDYLAARDAMTYAGDHSAAGRGRLFSGGYQADLSKAQGDLASQYLGNYRNSLFGIAGLGANAAGNLGSIGVGAGAQMGSAFGAQGNAAANGYGSWAGAIGGLGNTLGNLWGSSYKDTNKWGG